MTKDEIKSLAQTAIDTDRIFANDVCELEAKDWKKYGKDRTYFDAVRYKLSGKVSAVIKLGYYDNMSSEYIVTRGQFDVVERYTR